MQPIIFITGNADRKYPRHKQNDYQRILELIQKTHEQRFFFRRGQNIDPVFSPAFKHFRLAQPFIMPRLCHNSHLYIKHII